MSFEGYEQRLCANGHLEEIDVYCDRDGDCECGEEWVWRNIVDCTNESDEGYIELEIAKPIVTKTCECCGAQTMVAKETYKIPPSVIEEDEDDSFG